MELEVNSILVDLDLSSPFVVTYAVNELGSLETRQGSNSNDFTLLLTAKTREALGFSNNPNSVNSINPRVKIPAKLYDKRQLIDVGYLQIVEIDFQTNSATCSFFGSNNDWFSLVKDLDLNAIDLSYYNHVWNRTNIEASFENVGGYIYPFLNYGKWDESPTLTTAVEDWLPAIFVHTILSFAFNQIGYKLGGNFIKSPIYKKLILPYSNDGLPVASLESTLDKGIEIHSIPQIISSATGTEHRIEWNGNGAPISFWWNDATFEYSPQENGVIDISVILTVPIWYLNTAAGSSFGNTIQVIAYKQGTAIGTYTATANIDNGFYIFAEFSFKIESVEISTIQTIYFTVADISTFPTTEINFDIIGNNQDLIITWGLEYREGQTLVLSDFLPNKLKVADLLTTLCYQFGLFFQVDLFTKTVSVFQFEEVNRNKYRALDWSDKVDYSDIRLLNFTEVVQNYGQRSNLIYKENENDVALNAYVNDNNGNGFGDGYLTIDNGFIEPDVTILESKFSATINTFTFDQSTYIPFIPLFERNSDLEWVATLKPNNRILLLAENTALTNIIDTSIESLPLVLEGTDGSSNLYFAPFSYFYKRELGNDLDEFKETLAFNAPNITLPYGNTLIERNYDAMQSVLNEIEFLKLAIHLKPTDINNLDFSVPIFLNIQTEKISISGYFFIDTISEYSGGTDTTEVWLIQLR